MKKRKDETVCKLLFEFREEGSLEIETVEGEFSIARGITIAQALNIARLFTRKYDEVRLYDNEYEAYISMRNGVSVPAIDTYYPEEYTDVAKKFGLYVKAEEDEDQTDLDKEKWDNYWGNYSQCGVHINTN